MSVQLNKVEKSTTSDAEHRSLLGREPEYVDEETFKSPEAIQHGQAQGKVLSHKLSELQDDYYLFSLAPVYWMLGDVELDLVYQFGAHLDLDCIKNVITYRSPAPLFGGLGEWDTILQGLPKEYAELFGLYVTQAVFPQTDVTPQKYWRVEKQTVQLHTPGEIAASAHIDVFVPTGVDARFEAHAGIDGVCRFSKFPPNQEIVQEAFRFFQQQR